MPVPMVGRAAALDEVRRAWALVEADAAGLPVIITGPGGTGKSTLVSAALAAIRPATVLAGTARVHSPAPYDWLAAVLAGRPAAAVPVPPNALAWLAQDPHVPRERYAPEALLRLAVTSVRTLVGTGPAVIVVEDLHALDPASLNLVGELAAADLPALLLVTSRPAEAAVSPELTARTLARLAGTPRAIRRHLGPLTAEHVAAVLGHAFPGATVGAALARTLWQRTGGNPYRLTELLAAADTPADLAGPADPGGGRAAGAHLTDGADLTAREVDVLGCLAGGMSNKQVARALGISVRTVTVHVSNLLRKTGTASRTEAALWAVERGVGADERGAARPHLPVPAGS